MSKSVVIIIVLLLNLFLLACAATPKQPALAPSKAQKLTAAPIIMAEKNTSVLVSTTDRYRKLFTILQKQGMTTQRIEQIFSSAKANKKDNAAIKRISKKTTAIATVKSRQTINTIVKKVAQHIKKYPSYYALLEQRYGVNKEIAAAILYKETHLGAFSNWQHDAFIVLNSVLRGVKVPLAGRERDKKRIERIVDIAQRSLAALVLYCENKQIDILSASFPSSYAGAIGMPQFMPLYLPYAVSASNTDADLSKPGDAILSIGNILRNGFAWPGLLQLDKLSAIDTIFARYIEYDKHTQDASFCMSVDQQGYPLRRFVDSAQNIAHINYIASYGEVLMQYNFSSNYVLDVLQIAYHTHRFKQR